MRQKVSQTDNPGTKYRKCEASYQFTETRCHIHVTHIVTFCVLGVSDSSLSKCFLSNPTLLRFWRMHFLYLQCSNLLRASVDLQCPELQSVLSLSVPLAADWPMCHSVASHWLRLLCV